MTPRTLKSLVGIAIATGIGLASYGCGPSGPPVTVLVSPSTATVPAGGATSFTATVNNDTANRGVTWAVSCSTPPCGTVSPAASASGAPVGYTAPANAPKSDLKVTVTATSVRETGSSSSATVTVPAITVSVAPGTATVQVNGNAQFTATVANDPTGNGVNWTVSCSAAAC